jgi:hypothetical protein
MPEKTKHSLGVRTRVMLALALPIAFLSVAWVGLTRTSPEPLKAAAPSFNAQNVLITDIGTIRNYASQLHFDSVAGAADARVVDFDEGRSGKNRASPARIEPEESSHLLSEEELAQGRIIARIFTKAQYPDAGVGPGWTWWWVDRNGAGGTWRSIYISEGLNSKVIFPLKLTHHKGYYWKQALARFTTSSQWSTCSISGCCIKQRPPN